MRPHPDRKSKLLLFLPVIAVVFISGCTSSSGGGGPGVAILGWEPELRDVFSGDKVDLLLKVENQGESDARNVVAELANIDTNEWGTFGFNRQQLGNLIQFDPITNTPGETKTAQFTNLQAPELSRGTSFVYEPIVRVSYDYTTTAQKPITIVDKQELIKIKQQGQALPAGATTYTAGPLSIEIIMGDFVRSTSTFQGGGFNEYDIFPVHIKIRNTLWGSGGTVIPRGIGSSFGLTDADYPVSVRIDPPAGTSFVFSGFGNDCSSFQFTVDLFRGEQAEVTCELEVTTPPSIRTQSLIKIELDYRFAIDKSTQINVQGTRESGSGFLF